MTTIGIMPLDEFYASGDELLARLRWRVFGTKGLSCSHPGCEFVATHAVWWTQSNGGLHVDAFGGPNLDVMLTLDHHIPKSLGGQKTLDNLNPMCQRHNSNKKNKIPEDVMEDFLTCLVTLTHGLRYLSLV